MRPPALLLALAAAACSAEQDPNPAAAGQAIACAHGADWTAACRLERTVVNDRDLLVVHRPDGAFQRFVVLDGGLRVAAADGAAQVTQRRLGGLLEVTLGEDRYRLPLAPGGQP